MSNRKGRAPVHPWPKIAEWAGWRKGKVAAKTDGIESKPETPVYTAADGTLWVEDPDGTHGWWSVEPGYDGDEVASFQPWRGRDGLHGDRMDGGVLRYYRRVEKR